MRLESVTLAAVVSGTVVGPPTLFSGYSIDSRAVEEGDLFVAVKGPNNDGHDFLAQALERAAGALVSRAVPRESVPEGRTLVRVPDTLAALRIAAGYARETLALRVVGITGSVGKTTTKELAAAVLSRRYETARSKGNLNNEIGLPLELLRVADGTEIAVLEMGMSTPGEIRRLSDLARPEVACVTTVAPAHLEGVGSLEGVLEAKAEILSGLSTAGTFVANADDERVLRIAARHRGPVLRYGIGAAGADVTAEGLRPEGGGTRFRLRTRVGEADVLLPLPGAHNVSNFLAAAAIGVAFGVPAADAAEAASAARAAAHRGEVRLLPRDVLLYDDSYNSSPRALEAAYAAFESASAGRRRVAVVGEMRELGAASRALHEAAGRALAGRFDLLVAVAGNAAALAGAARQAGAPAASVHVLPDAAGAAAFVAAEIRPGDGLFVKGSRGVGLDAVVAGIAGAGS